MWPFDDGYPQKRIDALRTEYDYIIVGGGNAGCVLARRLSEDPRNTVLLVERGDAGDSWLHRTPLTSFHHVSDGRHSVAMESLPDAGTGRSFTLLAGSGLGGTTRINGAQYTCGVPAEYNSWNQDGRSGWSYKELKPFFDKSEHWVGPVPREYHGSDGPLQVQSFPAYNFDSSRRTAEAAERLGFPGIQDMHSPLEPSVGCNKMQFTIESSGYRSSAFRAYLPQEYVQTVGDHLHICTKTAATRLKFATDAHDKLRAIAVEIEQGPRKRTVKARREIVLTCGALSTPKLLLLSGVGPQDHLREMGIPVVLNSPGVGESLQDHVIVATCYNSPFADSLLSLFRSPTTFVRELYKYLRYGRGWLLGTFVETEVFGISSLVGADGKPHALRKEHEDSHDPKNLPDFGVLACPIAANPSNPDADRSKGLFALNVGLFKSQSYGRLRLRSRDPYAHPACEMRYLTAPADLAAIRAGLRVSQQLAREICAGGYELTAFQTPVASDDATLDAYARAHMETMYHYSSSCRMAPMEDSRPGVVDDELRVHGIRNLRIADASIFPTVPATHPQALVYAIAEKCADMMRGCGVTE
ncbi:alcohol oxidase [Artomyces pyxidatus]|uniref:Alcohol oxidase n=1 Tax=Artomyces pyxidatus TaxID=48021 RepID=A0ACB8SYB7_9AGAM|nr:alcohol oxidase [Artomyces pyxidatus]